MRISEVMQSRVVIPAAVAVSAIASGAVSQAHHAFAAELDRDKPIELTGPVTKVEWTNPHARFYVDAPDPDLDGSIVTWNFELGSPNGLIRQGWRRDTLRIGDTISVSGWRARNDAHVASAREVTDAAGKRLFAGSSAEAEANGNN